MEKVGPSASGQRSEGCLLGVGEWRAWAQHLPERYTRGHQRTEVLEANGAQNAAAPGEVERLRNTPGKESAIALTYGWNRRKSRNKETEYRKVPPESQSGEKSRDMLKQDTSAMRLRRWVKARVKNPSSKKPTVRGRENLLVGVHTRSKTSGLLAGERRERPKRFRHECTKKEVTAHRVLNLHGSLWFLVTHQGP